jgi:tetratricopeptide (TPR) repeat protein
METPEDDLNQRIEALMNQGYEHLEQEDYEEALEVARQLEELQFTAAFELAALAHDGQGDVEAAVRVLHRGVEAAPDCWPIWQMLGNYLSDLERYEEAEAAFEQALECDDPWTASIRLNQAILARRRELHEKAIELLDEVDDPELKLHVAEQWVGNLKQMGRNDEAVALAEPTLAENRENDEDADTLARTAALLGQIWLEQDHDREEILQLVLGWLEIEQGCEQLLAVLREVDGQHSPNARGFDMTLHAELPEGHSFADDPVGYYIVCHVVADNPEEALQFVRRLETEELSPRLEIEEARESEADPQMAKGVYWRSGRIFYGDEE